MINYRVDVRVPTDDVPALLLRLLKQIRNHGGLIPSHVDLDPPAAGPECEITFLTTGHSGDVAEKAVVKRVADTGTEVLASRWRATGSTWHSHKST